MRQLPCVYCENKFLQKEPWTRLVRPLLRSAPIETKPASHRNPPGPNDHTSTHGIGPSGIPSVYAPPSFPIRKPRPALDVLAAPVYQPMDHSVRGPGTMIYDWSFGLCGGDDETWHRAHQTLSLPELETENTK